MAKSKSGRRGRGEEVRAWLEVRERESLTYDEVARRSGIPKGTLTGWSVKFRKEARKAGSGLARVQVTQGAGAWAGGDGFAVMARITLRGGRTVEVSADHDVPAVVRLVKMLEEC